jgi:two-component system C4-dicarboxylate transport response regulator DctD
LDLRMPEMDGRALLAAVRASGLAPRVVLFSADREVAAAAQELACEAFVEKPFAPESLLAAVRRALAPLLSPSK